MHFAFAFEDRYRLPARMFGVRPDTTGLDVVDGRLTARFGPWRVSVELANITAVAVTGPYRFLKTAGPARLGVTDRGLTLATRSRDGVELTFADPITGIDPLGVIRHPNLTVTPADVPGFVAAVSPHAAR